MMEQLLCRGLETLGLPTDGVPALERYAALLDETNKVMNLTAITDPEEVATLHFLDSARPADSGGLPEQDGGRRGHPARAFPACPCGFWSPPSASPCWTPCKSGLPSCRGCAMTWALTMWPVSTAGRRNLPRPTGNPLIW